MKFLVSLLIVTAATAVAAGQDPIVTLPDSYSLQFENEWVKVVRVRYAPHAKLPAHTHTALPAAYVYLNDGGPVLFRHIDAPYGPATRPPTKAGGFRVYKGLKEVHEVENRSDVPSEFLRIEFKTDPQQLSTLKGRFFREPDFDQGERVQFENAQVRITRLRYAAGPFRLTASTESPALLIALTPTHVRRNGADLTLALGQEHWLGAGSGVALECIASEPVEFLRFDFKTRPVPIETQGADNFHASE